MDPSKRKAVDKTVKLKAIIQKEGKMKDKQRNKKNVVFMLNVQEGESEDEAGEEGDEADSDNEESGDT